MDRKIVFIVNPAAGKRSYLRTILSTIEDFAKEHGNSKVILTKAREDATKIAKDIALSGEKVRIFACGGDGTLNEVLNGIVGFNNVELGCIPAGSGNDFIKSFGTRDMFLDIEAQVQGSTKRIDIIKANDRYAINICSIGLDAKIGANMIRFKRIPFVSGKLSYNLSIIYSLFSKISADISIKIDEEKEVTGRHLFALAANGRYYGGSYMGAPLAICDDGLLDFVLVKAVSRFKILDYLKKYSEGTHLELDMVSFIRGKRMIVTANSSKAYLNSDGECESVKQTIFEVVPSKVDFIVPKHRDVL